MNKKLTIFLAILFSLSLVSAQGDICGIRLVENTSVAAFAHSQNVGIEFDYEIAEPGGARIFARPFTNGALSPGYSASGSPLYAGSGTGTGTFSFAAGEVLVDEIRILVTNADQSATLREMWVPVHYQFSENGVNNFQFSSNPEISSFLLGEKFDITFDYAINQAGGARIFVRPFSGGSLTNGYSASGSILFSGTGTQSVNFTINSGIDVRVDSLRVMVTNADQSSTLQEFFIPVNLYFSTVKVTDVTITGTDFAPNGTNRTVNFNYSTTEAGGARIFPRPYSNTGLTTGYSACGSASHMGSGTVNCNFTINGSNQHVDHIRFQATNDDQSQVLLTVLYPVDLTFGEVHLKNIRMCPEKPVRMNNGERVNFDFDIENNTGAAIRIFPRPFTAGALSPGYAASGSPAYATGSTSSDAYFTISTGDVVVDQIRFRITNEDQSTILGEFFYSADYVFGNPMSTAIEVPTSRVQLRAFPNPFNRESRIEMSLDQTEQVQLVLFDMAGRELGLVDERKLAAGEAYSVNLLAADFSLNAGMYLLQVRGESFTETVKLVLTE